MQIDPWGSSQYQDYGRLRDAFGISAFGPDEWGAFRDPHILFRRGVVFGHRDFERVADAIRGRDPWAVMTGLMPSGKMHLGHKMVLDQVVAHQRAGADVHVAVADFEAVAARGMSLARAHELAMDEYVVNYLALGLDPGSAEVYYQTRRRRVQDLANRFATRVNWSQMQALYGFAGETSIAHVNAPIVQAADILHVQHMGKGPRPVLVPVGVDQDPHLRLTRDIAQSMRRFNVLLDEAEGRGSHVVVVKGDDEVARWLDVADRALDDLGLGTRAGRTRKDSYGRISIGRRLEPQELRALDLALARAEHGQGEAAFVRPSATFHRFMTGLTGGKMSSSRPETSIFLTDAPDEAVKKVKGSVTGGRDTAEEQRRLGANPYVCPVYEMYLYHLAEDEAHLQEVHDTCKSGARLCGGCKAEAGGLLRAMLLEHQQRREEARKDAAKIVAAE